MSTKPDDTAFPIPNTDKTFFDGMSKREYFAAIALQGLLANPEDWDCADPATKCARIAVLYADALIIALNK